MSSLVSSWDLDGIVDEHRYYCETSPINPDNLPTPKAMISGSARTHSDTDIVADTTYYVRVGSYKNGTEKISDEVVVTTSSGDIYLSQVKFLVFADAVSYPSKNIVDVTGKSTIVVGTPASIINNAGSKYDQGAIKIDAYAGQGGFTVTLPSNIGTGDFTFETHIKRGVFFSGWALKMGGTVSNGGFEANTVSVQLFSSSAFKLSLINNANTRIDSPFTIPISASEYVHFCVMRKNGLIYAFVDGVLRGSIGSPNHLALNINNKVYVGHNEGVYYLNSIRMTAVARYSETGFTPPTEKYQSI